MNNGCRVLPSTGNLNQDFPIGRFWRFQALGDPTVRSQGSQQNICMARMFNIRKFASRDVDSWILPRERDAVNDWEDRGERVRNLNQFVNHTFKVIK